MTTAQAVAAIERIIVAAGQSDFSRETIANARAGLDALLLELQTMRQSKEHESERAQNLPTENDQLRAELEKIRVALRGYSDSDLVSLAEATQTRLVAAELILATLCDMVLGEDTTDRSEKTLVRAVGELKRERDTANKKLEAFAHDVMCELHVHEANRLVDRAVCPLCERDAAIQRAEQSEADARLLAQMLYQSQSGEGFELIQKYGAK